MKIGTDDEEAKKDTTDAKATEDDKKTTGETVKVAGESGAGKADAGADTSGITGTLIICVCVVSYSVFGFILPSEISSRCN